MANFVVKADINGVEKVADVVGGEPQPIAIFDGVGYYHSINAAELDITKIYDLEGNELESEPQDGTPYIKNVGFAGGKWFGAVNVKASGNVILSGEGATFGDQIVEGTVEGLNEDYILNAYVKINEDDNSYATLYFNNGDNGSVTGPVSEEELNAASNALKNEVSVNLSALGAKKQDNLKPIEIGKDTLTFNELSGLLPKVNGKLATNVCVIKTLSGKIYQVMVGQYATSGGGNPEYVVNFVELNSNYPKYYHTNVYNLNNDLLNFSSFLTLVDASQGGIVLVEATSKHVYVLAYPSDTTKTYVLKYVNNALTWVEETA